MPSKWILLIISSLNIKISTVNMFNLILGHILERPNLFPIQKLYFFKEPFSIMEQYTTFLILFPALDIYRIFSSL